MSKHLCAMEMEIELDIREAIGASVNRVARESGFFDGDFEADVRIADPRHGDYQANGVLPWAKARGKPPRECAKVLMDALNASSLESRGDAWELVEIAGPGFLNFRLSTRWLAAWLVRYGASESLTNNARRVLEGKRVVIDYSAPNTAKQMHVGHIRSTVIGDAIARMLSFFGASVIRDNHIGDWGTQFGILIHEIKTTGTDLDQLEGDPIEGLEALYRQGSERCHGDATAMESARKELVLLQRGDPLNEGLWKRIVDISYAEFAAIYQRLDVRFDCVLGESFYRDKVERVCQELLEDGIAEESQGALVVFHREHARFATQPFIVRKSDGASNYATTDLATALYRSEHFGAEEVINVTDARQKDHFEQLELTVRKWFEKRGRPMPEMRHVTFGTVLGKDGKAIKTRSGKNIKLRELLDEAVDRAKALTKEKNPELGREALELIGEVIGMASVRYADLSQNRSSDYQFDWDKMLCFEGNTAPYLLYVVARIHGIIRKNGGSLNSGDSLQCESAVPQTETEIKLIKKLSQFVVVLKQSLDDLRPHVMVNYLYELCGEFNAFYHQDTVLHEDLTVRTLRLQLCASTLDYLKTGLGLLGIPSLEKM